MNLIATASNTAASANIYASSILQYTSAGGKDIKYVQSRQTTDDRASSTAH